MEEVIDEEAAPSNQMKYEAQPSPESEQQDSVLGSIQRVMREHTERAAALLTSRIARLSSSFLSQWITLEIHTRRQNGREMLAMMPTLPPGIA